MELIEQPINSARIRRAFQHVAEDRIEHHQPLQETFQQKGLLEQLIGKADDVSSPDIACVMRDGGCYQLLDPQAKQTEETSRSPPSRRKGKHWKES